MRILFLYVVDWSREIADFGKGLVPSHRLFGYAELKELGHQAFVCPRPSRFSGMVSKSIYWRIYQALHSALHPNEFDAIFAVNEATAIPLLVLKRLGLLKTPVIVFNTGLMHPRNRCGSRKAMWRWLLPAAEAVVSQTTMEQAAVWKEFGLEESRQFLIPMLVDLNFFKPDEGIPTADYCLAVGTTEGKDYRTLLKALPRNEKLVIVTDAYNAAIVRENLEEGMDVSVQQAVPIQKLKRMYQEAKVIINPLADTPYGTGHTVVLENMVLGKPVIVTSVPGIDDYFDDGMTAIAVKPADPDDLRSKIQAYLENPGAFSHIAEKARHWVHSFSSQEFARKLIAIAQRLQPQPTAGKIERPTEPVMETHIS